jgi:hypothetical protein
MHIVFNSSDYGDEHFNLLIVAALQCAAAAAALSFLIASCFHSRATVSNLQYLLIAFEWLRPFFYAFLRVPSSLFCVCKKVLGKY